MGKRLYTKLEPATVQGLCVACGVNKQNRKGGGRYRPICAACHVKRHDVKLRPWLTPWARHKGPICEKCGFVPEHPCQLDVDHIDGSKANADPSNYQTLCANCHRLKTYLARDWEDK